MNVPLEVESVEIVQELWRRTNGDSGRPSKKLFSKTMRPLVLALLKYSNNGHFDTCAKELLPGRKCSCGYDELRENYSVLYWSIHNDQ